MTKACKGVMIAATGSGVGKTSISLALTRAFARRGLRTQTYKVGPDYLDPTYLALASKRPCYNLDGWMMGPDYVQELYAKTSADADVTVVEGVMGLFDGANPAGLEGTSAEIAMLVQVPVVLAVNVHGMAGTLAPIVKGFVEFDPRLSLAGVIANKCGGERHGMMLKEALDAAGLPKLIGAVPRGAFPSLPSRHLGLVTAREEDLTEETLDRLADAIETHASLDLILGADTGPARTRRQDAREPEASEIRARIGLAYDEAFHFYYADNLDALASNGAEMVRFSPVRDARLPEGLDGLYLGGGYPEEYAEQLSANTDMLDSIRHFADSGKPIYAECGGLMYLSRGIETLEQGRHALVGIVPAWTRMLKRLRSLGYVEVELKEDTLVGKAGDILRGHEFHYSELTEDSTLSNAWRQVYSIRRRKDGAEEPAGFWSGNVLASYVHLHLASRPESAPHFIERLSGL